MAADVDLLILQLFKRGFSPPGLVYILRLLAEENPPDSERRKQLELAAEGFLE